MPEPITTGLAIAGGSAAISGLAGMFAGNAAEGAARMQAEAAERISREAKQYGAALEGRVRSAAEMSPSELRAYEGSLAQAQRLVDADAQLLASIDPTILETSKQALKLLRGEDADALGPLRNQRNSQRQQLLSMLREQYGAGAETSSLGQQALRAFDLETATLMSNTQQNTLNTFLGLGQNARGQMGSNISGLTNSGIAFGNASNRVANAISGVGQATLGAMTQTGQNIVNTAGAPFVGELTRAQGLQAMGNQGMQIGGLVLGQGLLGTGKNPGTGAMGYNTGTTGYMDSANNRTYFPREVYG